MGKIVYVKLLNEGTEVYRPVSATLIEDNVYKLGGEEIYDKEDETWEFSPETLVIVEEKELEGKKNLVAVSEYKK